MISYYESGKREPSLDVILRISDFLGIEVSDLMEESGDDVKDKLILAFRSDEIGSEAISAIVNFKKIVKNYMKLNRLKDQYAR